MCRAVAWGAGKSDDELIAAVTTHKISGSV
jgi:hypothetical protein